MRIRQLLTFLEGAIAAGVDPDTIVCTYAGEGENIAEVLEIAGARLVTGHFLEDPSPKCPSFLQRDGRVLLLEPGDIDLEPLEATHVVEPLPNDQPAKTWPNGWGIQAP